MRLWDIYHPEIPDFLLEAASTDEMLRLQGVGMNCGCEYTSFPLFRDLSPYSRFDHSVGVGLIVWHFTRQHDQAMAGLLHDISTPVFAHVVDFLRNDHMTQESTEAETAQFIRASSQIGKILSKHKIPISSVVDYHLYPIADNDPPCLSADRLEYTLGNGVNYQFITREEAKRFYDDLLVGRNEDGQPELMFRTLETAFDFARAALRCSQVYVSDADRYAMQILAELLADAIRSSVIREQDLYQNESAVISRLKRSSLASRFDAFCALCETRRRDLPGETGLWRQIHAKKRYIDPYVRNQGRISQLYPEFKAQLSDFLEEPQDQWLLGI